MKKISICILAAVLILTCLTACDIFERKPGYDPSLKCAIYENCAVFTFDGFSIGETASFELERTGLGEGAIYYQINLDEGALSISYKDTGLINGDQPLGEFTSDGEMPINGSGGYIEGNRITVTFEALRPVSGEIIIAFSEDALKAVHGNLQLHQHTCEYEIREDAHKKIYTCDCDWLEERDFERHYDDNIDGKCDECEYYMGIPHEDHNWGYDVNETSHRQIFGCGCQSPESYEPHYNNDGDNLCDACGYDMGIILIENALLQEYEVWISQLESDDVSEIKTTFEYVGVAPGNLKNISRTSDKSVISDVIEKYKQLPMMSVSAEDTYISGGSAFTVEFILADGTVKELFFNNGHYVYGFNQDTISALCYFRLDAPTLEGYDNVEKSYGFITYREPGHVLRYDGSCEPDHVCDIEVSAFEFVEVEAPSDSTEWDLYVNTEFGTLVFIGNSVFYIMEYGDKYYQLTGKNLDEMIEDALNEEYTLTMNDPEWLYEELSPTYKAGEVVSVKIKMAIDLGYIFLVNGEDIANERDTDGKYWEFTFTMPDEDAEIDFLTYDGFLPDWNYSVLIKAYWMKNLDKEYVYIDKYYGEMRSGALVAMIVSGGYDDLVWQEKVGDVTVEYCNGNRITVYYGGEFYTLTEAYEKGYVTSEELREIADLHAEE